jgi:hypothetical protein
MCHSRHAQSRHRSSAVHTRVPARPERSDVRASDDERERVVALLREHAAAGRLEVDELDQRVEAAFAATTRAELRALLDDLPEDRERRDAPESRGAAWGRYAPPNRPMAGSSALIVYAGIAAVLVVVWALTGAGGFWPAWFIGFGALAVFKHGGRRARRWAGPPRTTL